MCVPVDQCLVSAQQNTDLVINSVLLLFFQVCIFLCVYVCACVYVCVFEAIAARCVITLTFKRLSD